jgi:hypothetical protein
MQLRAGILSMTYEDGFLRHIAAGEKELLKMIYFAVRDAAWDTLPSVISHEHITRQSDSFTISYQRSFDHAGIQMHWEVTIEGSPNAEISFEIKGQALNSFRKNRTGLCILHPIEACAGKEVLITHTDHSMERSAFPVYISPHQPFFDLMAMQWPATPQYTGKLHFKGDIFETEDQRNWTDDSFKTYCTPLHYPYPVLMQQGDEVRQSVHFSLTPSPIPAIGIGRSTIRNKNYLAGLESLSGIGFTHYRTDLHLAAKDWQQTLKDSLEESKVLNAPLEIALHLTEDIQLHRFTDTPLQPGDIKSITLLTGHSPALLKKAFPDTLIGAGTDSHFTDLNRSGLSAEGLDFVSYAIHPQVHAFDDRTLMENAAAQGYTVETARHKFGLPVHISPITLHDRHITDPRLHTDFGAQWTAASLQALLTAGAASITYFEALGERGVAAFDAIFTPFPVLKVLQEMAKPDRYR